MDHTQSPSGAVTDRDALVGFSGFVGSNLCRQHHFHDQYNSSNINAIREQSFNRLVFAGAPAQKWIANQQPSQDWENLAHAMDALQSVRARQVILISTVDVIPDTTGQFDETVDCSRQENHPYGSHRFKLEQQFRQRFPNLLIVRLPGLFGPGLKKNVIYDLLHDNMLDAINPASAYQYYDLTRLWGDIETALQQGLTLVHLFPQPIKTQILLDRFFADKTVGSNAAPEAHYDLRTKYSHLYGGPPGWTESADSVMNRLAHYIQNERAAAGQ